MRPSREQDRHAAMAKIDTPRYLYRRNRMSEVTNCNVTFDQIGGLKKQISALREMVVLPLMYPEIFQKLQIKPPRGILFYGEPGTGKTLLARALACELCQDGRRVTFLSRKATDCLNMWLGQSEKQLVDVFEEAKENRPAVIFFDEIDGLAPARNARQEQVHSSIVSTLLAQMDGLDPRGEVVVIGATNRIDALDPALRRPGRFDREMQFPLPNTEDRYEILQVHTRDWQIKPPDKMLHEFAESTRGACGADLESLCVEAGMAAVKRCFPEIYESRKKLPVELSKISVERCDFDKALLSVAPAKQRMSHSPSRPLPPYLGPLLMKTIKTIKAELREYFPQGFSFADLCRNEFIREEYRFLLTGPVDCGQTSYIAPALLNQMECPLYSLTLTSLHENSCHTPTPEEACVQIFRDAKTSAPSVIYIPDICVFWEQTSETVRSIFDSTVRGLEMNTNILIFATAQTDHHGLPEELKQLFIAHRHKVINVALPSKNERTYFFQQLYQTATNPPLSQLRESQETTINRSVPIYCLRGRVIEAAVPDASRNCQRCLTSEDEEIETKAPFPVKRLLKRSHSSSLLPSQYQKATREEKVRINLAELQNRLGVCVAITSVETTKTIVYLYQRLSNRCQNYVNLVDREGLIMDFDEEIKTFKKCHQISEE